jgi:hypothetical protein
VTEQEFANITSRDPELAVLLKNAAASIPSRKLTGLGGVLGTLGFLLFAASLWPALGNLPSTEP